MSTGHLSFCHCKKLLTRPFPASKILSGLHIRKIFPLDSVGRKEHVCLLQTCSLQWPHWPWVTRHLYNFFRHCDKRVLQCKQMSPPGATHHTSPAASTFWLLCVCQNMSMCRAWRGSRVDLAPREVPSMPDLKQALELKVLTRLEKGKRRETTRFLPWPYVGVSLLTSRPEWKMWKINWLLLLGKPTQSCLHYFSCLESEHYFSAQWLTEYIWNQGTVAMVQQSFLSWFLFCLVVAFQLSYVTLTCSRNIDLSSPLIGCYTYHSIAIFDLKHTYFKKFSICRYISITQT